MFKFSVPPILRGSTTFNIENVRHWVLGTSVPSILSSFCWLSGLLCQSHAQSFIISITFVMVYQDSRPMSCSERLEPFAGYLNNLFRQSKKHKQSFAPICWLSKLTQPIRESKRIRAICSVCTWVLCLAYFKEKFAYNDLRNGWE